VHHLRSYQLAVQFYRKVRGQKVPLHLRDQFLRAASSIALNLGEGSAKPFGRDRRRFYLIALGSVRECEAIIELISLGSLAEDIDKLARHVYRLCQALS